ncbi:hypothetical protein Acr_00g0030900 [Actinidia rufa]|uniref:Uncharacterized protein n=1 Tax=Actinidia rufa TaxID=165716 RepID=A0A7J0DF71_9ERIC|nr:hypothetical protein Acr_00g0030900 [Actinidia rufa]
MTNSPKMDTSSLTKESNVMSQAELDNLGATYSFPPGVRLRIPGGWRNNFISPPRRGSVLRSRVSGRFKASHSSDHKGNFDSLQDLPFTVISQRMAISHLFAGDLASLSNVTCPVTNSGAYTPSVPYLIRGGTTSRRGPRRTCSEDLRATENCNKLPALSEVDAKRIEIIFGKTEPGGYFEVSKVLGSRTFKKHFAFGCTALSSSGGDNTTSSDEGEFGTREDSVEYLGVIRRDIGGAIRRALPGIPDKTLLRWLGGKVNDSFMNLLSGKSGS